MGMARQVFWMAMMTVLFSGSQARADLYTFVDAKGTRHFTNVPVSSKCQPYQHDSVTIHRPSVGAASGRQAGFSSRCSLGKSSTVYDYHIRQSGYRYNVDPLLIKAIIQAESGFNCYATSEKGAQGLMQLMPGTARDLSVYNPLDPRANIDGGTRYFRTMLDTFHGNIPLSLAAYNAGPNLVKQTNTIPQIPETVEYVQRVLQHYKGYKQQNWRGGPGSSSVIRVGDLVTVR